MYLCSFVEVDPSNETTFDAGTGVGGVGFGWTVSYAEGAGGGAVLSAGRDGVIVLVVENRSEPVVLSATDVEVSL